MKNKFSFFAIIALFTISYTSSAQKVLDKGTIKMEITNVAADDPNTATYMELIKGSQTELYFDGEQHVTYMNMIGGMMEMKVKVEKAKNQMNLLFDMMGQKMWVESKVDESQNAQQKEIASLSKIEYNKADTKEILGYKCYKMTISNPEMEGITVSSYITEDIKTKANLIQGFQSLDFAGYPMEFTIGNPKFSMTMTAKDVKDSVDASKFEINTAGYKKMTMEEFQEAMKGFGGMGF